MKAFVIDLEKCVGCHDCQIGCKDEHCGNDWRPTPSRSLKRGTSG